MAKDKILLLIKIPPPVTGATLMNTRVRDSELLKQSFNIDIIQMSYASSINDLGSYRLMKFVKYIKYSSNLFFKVLFNRYAFAYFQISPLGISFLRDCFLVSILKLFNVKILYHLKGKGISKQNNYLFKKLYRYIFNYESVIILSELLKYDIEDVHKGQVFIVPNGIPVCKNNYRKNKYANESLNLLFLSNLLESKGLFDFIDAMKILNNKGIVFNAVIVGAEGDISEKELEKILIENSLQDRIKYLGPKFGEDKIKIYEATDILVFPTLEDIWGNVNLEAMQFGIPIIATREGAIPEIIDDKITGFLVDKNQPDQIADKVEILSIDAELRKKMGEAGRKKFLEKYTFEIFEENMKRVFETILSKN
ncbi:MAG: glycosyltransferase family 4 protein [Ignavibacteriota bacterium]|nr:glycosyltransferase [Ignavibacteriota bacterium]QKJ98989.1 MAG: glycosyltransferase family 4 protein [Ignavibacteriota bacterium]